MKIYLKLLYIIQIIITAFWLVVVGPIFGFIMLMMMGFSGDSPNANGLINFSILGVIWIIIYIVPLGLNLLSLAYLYEYFKTNELSMRRKFLIGTSLITLLILCFCFKHFILH